ncbi:MAG: BMP family ABC transporter substrate-binding protein, partial [Acidimicrobiaceae bacterium]|nr:BMP family ABC transporter substrate-binding protein [Acidimicrobiaceae bacterium]
MTDRKNRRGLILPPSASMSRRDALKMGVAGIGGLAVGGSLLAACGDDEEAAPAATTAAPTTTAAATTTAAPAGKDSIKAAFVYIGPPDDNGWTQEHDRGRLAAEAALGDRLETSFVPNIGFDAGTTQTFQQLVDDGNDIIFANTEYAGLLTEVSDNAPDTKFCEINGHYYSDNLFP